jgi:hypothetical protein
MSDQTDRVSHLIGRQRGTIADTLAGARASLKNPSRPFTPADPLRRLAAHPLLPSSQQPSAPATPLLYGGFEPERPFTGRVTASGRSQRLLRKHVSADGVAEDSESQPSTDGAQILVLNDDDTEFLSGTAGSGLSMDDTSRKQNIWPVVESLLSTLSPGMDSISVMRACDKLLELLSIKDAIGQLGTSQRSDIVRAAARCLESSEPIQVAKLAGVILLVTKGGPNLLACAKILFRFSKSASNDDLFIHEGLYHRMVGAIGESRLNRVISAFEKGRTSEAMIDAEAMVYLIGAMKNFSATNLPNQKSLILEGAVNSLVSWIWPFCKATPSASLAEWAHKGQETLCNLLLQVTGVLRNLAVGVAGGGGDWQVFVDADIARALRALLVTWTERTDLVLNVTRVLSKMSGSQLCRSHLLDDAAKARKESACSIHDELVRLLHGLLGPDDDRRRYRLPAAIRACFVLGNLCAEEEEHRRLTVGWSDKSADEIMKPTWQLGLITEVLHRFTGEILALDPAAVSESGGMITGEVSGAKGFSPGPAAGAHNQDQSISGAAVSRLMPEEHGGVATEGWDGKAAAAAGIDMLVKVRWILMDVLSFFLFQIAVVKPGWLLTDMLVGVAGDWMRTAGSAGRPFGIFRLYQRETHIPWLLPKSILYPTCHTTPDTRSAHSLLRIAPSFCFIFFGL